MGSLHTLYVLRNLPHAHSIEILGFLDSFAIHQNCQFAVDFRESYLLVSIYVMGYYLGPIVEFL